MNVRQIFNWNLIFRKFEETPNTQKYENKQWRKTKWQSRGKKAKRQFLPRKTKQASRKKINMFVTFWRAKNEQKRFSKWARGSSLFWNEQQILGEELKSLFRWRQRGNPVNTA